MTRFLLDTDHVSLQEHNHPQVVARIALHPPGDLAVSAITAKEQLKGRLAVVSGNVDGKKRVRGFAKLVETILYFNSITIVPFDDACEKQYQLLKGMRLSAGPNDLMIAATALVNGLIVVTRNTRDFGQVPGLTIEDWTVP